MVRDSNTTLQVHPDPAVAARDQVAPARPRALLLHQSVRVRQALLLEVECQQVACRLRREGAGPLSVSREGRVDLVRG
jgi:hypothetical protein